jgi:hypothetical protein
MVLWSNVMQNMKMGIILEEKCSGGPPHVISTNIKATI